MQEHSHKCGCEHHGHHHHSHGDLKGKNLFIAVILNVVITVAQVIGGLFSGSLALLSDALHNFSDVASLLITYFAAKISKKERNLKLSFGYKRAEILAALFNSSVLVGIAVFLIVESLSKLFSPEPIDSMLVVWLALLSIVMNFLSVLLLHSDAKNSMNIKSAYLHLMTDMMTSVALLFGGLAMMYLGWYWLDPLISIAIALYLIYASLGLIKESGAILMQSAPEGIEIEELAQKVASMEGVNDIHHIHLWSLNEREIHLEAHIDFSSNITLEEFGTYISKIEEALRAYGITHVTLQPEVGRCEDRGIISSAP